MSAANNSTATRLSFQSCNTSDVTVDILVICYAILAFLVVFGNSLIVLVVWKNKSMRSTSNLFLANISVSDILFGLTVPATIPVTLQLNKTFQDRATYQLNKDINLAVIGPQGISCMVSTMSLVVLAIERYNALLHPMKVQRRMTKTRAKKLISFIWVFSISLFLPCFFPIADYRSFGVRPYLNVVFFIYTFAPLPIFIYSYVRIIFGI